MNLTLGIDTSAGLAVGLARDRQPAGAGSVQDSRAHAERLMPLIRSVLDDAGADLGQVTVVAVGMGPGPFTGLRVGIVTAQTLAWSLGVPLRRVCGLDVLARQAVPVAGGRPFAVAADARRRELYWARYAGDGTRTDGPAVGPPPEVPDALVVGPGAVLYADVFGDRLLDDPATARLDAGLLAALAEDLPDPGGVPLYLRRPDATVPTRRKSTLVVPRERAR